MQLEGVLELGALIQIALALVFPNPQKNFKISIFPDGSRSKIRFILKTPTLLVVAQTLREFDSSDIKTAKFLKRCLQDVDESYSKSIGQGPKMERNGTAEK
ncbi:hypothetical protein RUM43_003546 [Polyplax serrata]|uniref:Uncharacterized protein n=1 Tax=Polyplax serrata TaxID=468196 RepID=A0AAN8PEX5_POLSC